VIPASPYTDAATATTALAGEGRRLLDVVAANRGVRVPSCPAWDTDTMLVHVARVHRWAAGFLLDARTAIPCGPRGFPRLDEDRDLLDEAERWLTELEAEVRMADASAACWTFSPDDATCGFWMRRQVHETFVHRLDAELAAGLTSHVDPGMAVDAIREAFELLVPLALAREPLATGGTLDLGDVGSWRLGQGSAAVSVRAEPGELLLAVYGRRSWAGLATTGDTSLLDALEAGLRF
jgi:uncharacterized protein (TIGR03083 family)